MCDYSLHLVASTPAKVGDRLITTKFDKAATRGFAAVEDPNFAVCVLPGTEIAFDKNVDCGDLFGWLLPRRSTVGRLARFRKINMRRPDVHHDALEFPNGRVILLTSLPEGQHATVLQLPAAPHGVKEVHSDRPHSRAELLTVDGLAAPEVED